LDVSDDLLAIDDVEPPKRGTEKFIVLVLDQHPVISGHLAANITDERDLEISDTPLRTRSLLPRQVSEMAIDTDAKHLSVELLEGLVGIREGVQL
jgi:hypothetical protein